MLITQKQNNTLLLQCHKPFPYQRPRHHCCLYQCLLNRTSKIYSIPPKLNSSSYKKICFLWLHICYATNEISRLNYGNICWCPGFLRRHPISHHDTHCVKKEVSFLYLVQISSPSTLRFERYLRYFLIKFSMSWSPHSLSDSLCLYVYLSICFSWWRHPMETFSVLLAICVGNSPVTGEFPTQRPVTRIFDVFFDLRLNKRLSKQSGGWWFETPSPIMTSS